MDIALKQRLVGASVLIALAVVVLPMLLGGRPDGGAAGTTRIEIEETPGAGQFQTRRFPIGEEPAPAQRDDAQASPLELPTPTPTPGPVAVEAPEHDAGEVAETPREPATPAAEPVTGTEPAEMAQGEEAPAPSESVAEEAPPPAREAPPVQTGAEGRYVVQVASFGSAANADKLSATLRDLGYVVLTDTVSSDVGTLNRVRVGPYASETEANQVVTRLRQQVRDSKPRVMDLQPDRAERVTEPSDPMVRWVVQVGSFSKAGNAENLVARLRLEGQSAYSERVSGSGSTIHRVRVGPFVERDAAIRAERLIRERLALDGVVMSAD